MKDGATLDGSRIGGMWRATNGETVKIAEAATGDIVALGRLDGVATGAVLGDAGDAELAFPPPPQPVYALAITTADRKDDVRLSGALQKLVEEDPGPGAAPGPGHGRDHAGRPGRDAPARRRWSGWPAPSA